MQCGYERGSDEVGDSLVPHAEGTLIRIRERVEPARSICSGNEKRRECGAHIVSW